MTGEREFRVATPAERFFNRAFAEAVIGVSLMVHANVFGFLLAPLMLTAFVSLIAAAH